MSGGHDNMDELEASTGKYLKLAMDVKKNDAGLYERSYQLLTDLRMAGLYIGVYKNIYVVTKALEEEKRLALKGL